MIAALPALAGAEAETAEFWSLIRDHLREHAITAPGELEDTRPVGVIGDEHLLLAEIPAHAYLSNRADLTLIGTFDRDIDGVPAGFSCRILLKRTSEETPVGPVAATDASLAEIFERRHSAAETPAEAARAVAEGSADLAAMDVTEWRRIRHTDTDLAEKLEEVARSDALAGPALVTRQDRLAGALRIAIAAAVTSLPPETRTSLGISGLLGVTDAAYDRMSSQN
ncbi:PhnD/SsuA/transferrin family substrate-binding protein [Tropicimonas sp. IMCC34011]|uniref:PhnD/SsuA/transferrin family substrate-binding protein n=1 Tax=Tropicimonas sp. IMCC34011 TaxID=2248759 RepID=UPI000E240E2F|nr:PhnD/SsuA/transferrin family substrate-binding protein [Tropicimonas sp. IMCC34011]